MADTGELAIAKETMLAQLRKELAASGARARNAKLTPGERTRIAKLAAQARWAKKAGKPTDPTDPKGPGRDQQGDETGIM